MNLSPDQKATVTSWISAGDNLSAVQKKLRDQFQISMTYMDVRFLVDDLNLTLKDPAPKADTSDVTKAKAPAAGKPAAASAPEKKGLLDKAKEKLGLGKNPSPAAESDELPAADALEEDALPPVPGNVTIELDGGLELAAACDIRDHGRDAEAGKQLEKLLPDIRICKPFFTAQLQRQRGIFEPALEKTLEQPYPARPEIGR